jgi:hypothetical protein
VIFSSSNKRSGIMKNSIHYLLAFSFGALLFTYYVPNVTMAQSADQLFLSSQPPRPTPQVPPTEEEADDQEVVSESSQTSDMSTTEATDYDTEQDSSSAQASSQIEQEQTDSEEDQLSPIEDQAVLASPMVKSTDHADMASLYSPELPSNPSKLGAYKREYEGSATVSESTYDAMLESNFQAALNRHPFEGPWMLEVKGETQDVRFEFRQHDKNKIRVDGAWRGDRSEYGAYGLLSDSSLIDDYLEINYQRFGDPSPSILMMRASGRGLYVGQVLSPEGTLKSATLKRLYRP